MHQFAAFTLASLALAGPAAAEPWAHLTTHAQLTGLKITVIDLDLHDGIDAGYSFGNGPIVRSSHADVAGRNSIVYPYYVDTDSNKNFGAVDASATIGTAVLQGTVRAQIVAGEGRMALPAAISASQDLAFKTQQGVFSSNAYAISQSRDRRAPYGTPERFYVAPNTRVTFEGLAEASVDLDVINTPFRWAGAEFQAASFGSMSIGGTLFNADGKTSTVGVGDTVNWQFIGPNCVGGRFVSQCSDKSTAWQALLSTSFETHAGQEFRGNISAFTGSRITYTIPEPATWALLLGGLLPVVALRRRARAKGHIQVRGCSATTR